MTIIFDEDQAGEMTAGMEGEDQALEDCWCGR